MKRDGADQQATGPSQLSAGPPVLKVVDSAGGSHTYTVNVHKLMLIVNHSRANVCGFVYAMSFGMFSHRGSFRLNLVRSSL